MLEDADGFEGIDALLVHPESPPFEACDSCDLSASQPIIALSIDSHSAYKLCNSRIPAARVVPLERVCYALALQTVTRTILGGVSPVKTNLVCVSAMLGIMATMSARGADRPDFSGVWESEAWSTEGWPTEPPFNAAGRAAQEEWTANPQSDSSLNCYIPLGKIVSAPMPHEVLQQEDQITFLYEYEHQVRRVFMDGRDHPDSYPTLMGHSIGHWDGDTLVLETVGVEAGLFRPQGFPYTENLRLVERYSLIEDGDRMIAELIIDDPTYYAETWTVRKRYRRSESEIMDYECIVREHVPAQ